MTRERLKSARRACQSLSTSRLADLRSRCSTGGDRLCRYSMPLAASSASASRRPQPRSAAAACARTLACQGLGFETLHPIPCRWGTARTPQAQHALGPSCANSRSAASARRWHMLTCWNAAHRSAGPGAHRGCARARQHVQQRAARAEGGHHARRLRARAQEEHLHRTSQRGPSQREDQNRKMTLCICFPPFASWQQRACCRCRTKMLNHPDS